MQTGKFLGIGAALSAGLLAAHVASASVQLELTSSSGGSEFLPTTATSSSSYTTSTSETSFGGFSWSSLSVTADSSGQSSLTLSVSGLKGSGELKIEASGNGFTFDPSSATLAMSGTGSLIGPNSGTDIITGGAQISPSNTLFATTSGAGTGFLSATPPAQSGVTSENYTLTGSGGTQSLTSSQINSTGYTLNVLTTFTSFDSAQISGSFIGSVPGTAAVTLPGSGPLTIVGGLVVVGGLAVRRRMKV